MHRIGTSAISASTAHLEWAMRPADERYQSVVALFDAARARRLCSEERTLQTGTFHVEADASGDLALRDSSDAPLSMTHWSFEQLATLVGAPASYLRSLPGSIASHAINHGLGHLSRGAHQVLVERSEPWTLRAITSPRYAQVHHDGLVRRVRELMAAHPAWHLPLAYKDGVYGAEQVPSGAYLGDRDMFLFMVDEAHALDDPTDETHSGLFRGFILRNSDGRRRGAHAGSVPVSSGVRQSPDLGLSTRGELSTPTRGGHA
jgi:hypothetical protein